VFRAHASEVRRRPDKEERSMATLVNPTKVQKLEYNVTTAEGAARITVVSGFLQAAVQAYSSGGTSNQSMSFKALLDPTLAPGKFRKATAIAALATTGHNSQVVPNSAQWSMDDAQATLDDESGQVQLIVDVSVSVTGTNSSVLISSISFQVTTLSLV
jgi:hypothetical protein